MNGLTDPLREFLDANRVGVIATSAADGRPRQSVVYYVRDGERLLISTLAGRAKAKDVGRTGWASLSVRGAKQPYPSATFSGPAEILTEDIGLATAQIGGRIAETEAPEPMSDEELAEMGRVILAITIERVSASTYLEGEG